METNRNPEHDAWEHIHSAQVALEIAGGAERDSGLERFYLDASQIHATLAVALASLAHPVQKP